MTTETRPKHTPEPWGLVPSSSGGLILVRGRDARDHVQSHVQIFPVEDALRIVACVNALEGIPTEAIEQGVVRELVEAVRNAEGGIFAFSNPHDSPSELARMWYDGLRPVLLKRLRSVLAKVEGREP